MLTFWWKAKSSSYEIAFADFVFFVGFAAVGTALEFAAFRSSPHAKYSRALAFWFFLSTTMVFAASEHIFPGKSLAFQAFLLLQIVSVLVA